MAATILIKRTQGTSPPTAAPVGTGVSFGELVYTYDVTNVGAGKSYKKLYIGHPDGNTNPPIAIGGEYYTDMLPGNPADFGKPTASKAVILNPQGKIDTWSVATDLLVGAAATVSGDLTVAGQLNVTGDISYDEVTGRNIHIAGIGTIATLGITTTLDTPHFTNRVGLISALAGVGATYNDFNSTSAQFEQINVSHASTTKNLTVTGIATIEDNVDLGAGTTIDRATLGATIIRKGVKLDNQIQIAHNVEIGENTVIAAQSGVAGSTKIGKNCVIGGQVGIVGHITIGNNVRIQAQSGIGRNVKDNEALQGSPALSYGGFNKSYVHFKNLPEIIKRFNTFEKKIDND